MNKYYTIGQLAQLAGISTKTLRVYERKSLLMPERNAENDYRIYGEEAVKTLGKIQLMKYLDFSLDQIADFLQLYENASRENVLLEQKRLLEKKREQLNTVIAHVDRAVQECRGEEQDSDGFLKALGIIVRNQRADEVVWRLGRHADEPRGWSRFIFEKAKMQAGMTVLDAGAGWENVSFPLCGRIWKQCLWMDSMNEFSLTMWCPISVIGMPCTANFLRCFPMMVFLSAPGEACSFMRKFCPCCVSFLKRKNMRSWTGYTASTEGMWKIGKRK